METKEPKFKRQTVYVVQGKRTSVERTEQDTDRKISGRGPEHCAEISADKREEFFRKQNSHREYELKLGKYEEYVRGTLEEYPYISAARMHDWLRECYPDFPRVCDKTVFNFVDRIRRKYGIGKNPRPGYGVIMRSCLRPPTGNMPGGFRGEVDTCEEWRKHEGLLLRHRTDAFPL